MKTVLNTFVAIVSCLVLAQCQNNENSQAGAQQETEVQQLEAKVVSSISPTEFQSLMSKEEGILIDVRTPEEISKSSIQGNIAIDQNSSDFEAKLNELDKTKTYLVYCRSGRRSLAAAKRMAEMGFNKIYNLESGINGWMAEGLPVE